MGLVALLFLVGLCSAQLLKFVPGRELVYNVVGAVDSRGEELSQTRSSGSVGYCCVFFLVAFGLADLFQESPGYPCGKVPWCECIHGSLHHVSSGGVVSVVFVVRSSLFCGVLLA
jgi:hypothetical protein